MRSLDVTVDRWLGRLLDEVDRLAALLGDAPTPPVGPARDDAAVATLRLDGSPVQEVPPRVEDVAEGTGTGPARGGWLEVLRSGTRELTTIPDEVLLAVEHRGARAGLDADDLAATLREELSATLAELHHRVTDGLLHPSVAATPRTSTQAVHDASLGRVLFFPVDPQHVGPRMDALATWVADADVHPVVRSGVLHHQVLDLHPFEAANGRLARIAARLQLATDGIDVDRVTSPERVLLDDPIGYLDEVGRSRRLGDPGVFVTRWAEAVADGLLATLAEVGASPAVEVPDATAAFLAERAGEPFTVADHRSAVGGGAGADDALARARLAGRARRVPGSRGLRWVALS